MNQKPYFCVKSSQKMNTEITSKIRELRLKKGLNHQEMADKLHITKSAYQRLEAGETYSWAKYLDELLGVFELSAKDFFKDVGKKHFHQNNYEGSVGYAENLYQENKEILEKLLKSKDDQIALLNRTIENLLKK
jgi:transcriptional regulator with XRE-family HTH domain